MDKNVFPRSQYRKEFLFKIGRVEDSRKRVNYFLQFPTNKKEGIIRIGTFGDSYTYGDEVEKGWSYPTQLQMIFNERFSEKKVEVLNFGMGAHGLQQHFLVWQEYAKKYNIDYVLLGPSGAQPDRDPAFTPPWNNHYYLKPPRGRYILKKDDSLDFINIPGETFLERYKNYYTLTPAWTILKYDKYFFNLWKRIYFPHLKTKIQNPFYYTDLNTEEEVSIINSPLLREMAQNHHKKILFFTEDQTIYDLYKKDKDLLNLNHIFLFGTRPLYYRYGHYSTLGYELWAEVFFNALQGERNFSLKIFKCEKGKSKITPTTPATKRNGITHLKNIFLYHKELQLAELSSFDMQNTNFKETKSLITFFNSSESFTTGMYSMIPFQLSEKSKVFIKTAKREILLGSVFPIDERNLVFGFQKHYILSNSIPTLINLSDIFSNNTNEAPQRAGLYIDDYKIANIKIDKQEGFPIYKMILPEKSAFSFKGSLSHTIRHKDLPEEMQLYFRYITENDKTINSPVLNFSCIKKNKRIHINTLNLDFL